ncbi:DUF6443 domain-containing protein [Chitinophaga pinensis]|uniref:YD repeat protein n=1 Tax=Chitinophaga pinensis (strain ATCC 43595 / DSM 2588 / LMG 13176 / NBRC 15968 / NCIMB 11800 / UQM 2034) TaxID=485918 RepID=A0A979GSN1_CHIPD|nr:DUF6443 domain-containing protein [Chitinophaga pinensis]ACU59569.1 YD repeat protein [Chitinophaga pinensis DSM 2588]
MRIINKVVLFLIPFLCSYLSRAKAQTISVDPGTIAPEKYVFVKGDIIYIKNTRSPVSIQTPMPVQIWEKSTDGMNWVAINNGRGSNELHEIATTTGTIYYRRKFSLNSNEAIISVQEKLTGGEISGAQYIAPGVTPSVLGNVAGATGGAGAYSYQWEYSDDETNWTLISGATAQTYQPAAVTATKYFHRKVSSGGQESFSNSIQLFLNNNVTQNAPAATTVNTTVPVVGFPGYSGLVTANLRKRTTVDILKPNVVNWENPGTPLSDADYRKQITYQDGISRPIQSVYYKRSRSGKDIVSQSVYDKFGVEKITPLPYVAATDANNAGQFRVDAGTAQQAYYNTLTAGKESHFYSTYSEENSIAPRNSIGSGPGKRAAGINKGARSELRVNTVADKVRIWVIGDNDNDIPSSSALYEPGALTVSIYTNDEGNKIYTYTDKEGRTVLESDQRNGADNPGDGARTYYIYDAIGNLRYILPPLATAYCVANNNWNFSGATSILEQLSTRYLYDVKGRIISSQKPGTDGPTYMVYDNRDRLIFAQDAKLRSNNKGEWILFFYDHIDRQVMRAVYKNASATRPSLQTQIDAAAASARTTSITIPAISDLYIDKREEGVSSYIAKNSIVFIDGFETNVNDEIAADINPNAPGTVESRPLSIIPGFDYGNYEPLVTAYYDNYNWSGAAKFSDDFQVSAGNNKYPLNVEPDYEVKGIPTGYKVKVLGTDQWLSTTFFYDRYGNAIQCQSDNISGGKDIVTFQYDFAGNVLSVYSIVKNPKAVTLNEVRTRVRNEYENGRIMKVYHEIVNGQAVSKLVGEYDYDEWGRITQNKLGTLETLQYDYDFQGRITGMNAAYAKDKSAGNYFGMQFFYDDGFQNGRTDDKLSGVTWRRKGDPDEWHAYGFGYNSGGGLAKADYTQNTGSNWNNTDVDYKVYDLEYDANGNIKKLKQDGMLLGKVKSGIDDLQYTYDNNNWSNTLVAVEDSKGNKQQGDFKDGVHTAVEYNYDENGNLINDLNKGITIVYNSWLNKPEKITFDNDATKSISFVYNAQGQRLQRIVKDGTNTYTYTYNSGYIYKNDKLLLFPQPQGRVRVNANGQMIYDYFISDNRGNTRTVITEETNEVYYKASHETNPQPTPAIPERESFNFPKYVDVIPAGHKFYDYQGTGSNRQFVKLNSGDPDRKIGTAKVLRVMAGDKVEVGVQSYYANNSVSNNTPNELPEIILNQLINSLLGPVAVIPNGHDNILQGTGNGLILNKEDMNTFLQNKNNANPPSQVPKAYLNYVLFDDNFKMIEGNPVRVSSPGEIIPLTGQLDVRKNGYLYVYLSNESNADVYFDDLVVKHTSGHLLQEDSYYPFGLQMRGLSSQALSRLENNYLYNGIEKISDFDLEIYDAAYRNLDPQTGRWWQQDPLQETMVNYSPYNSNFNDPINFSDPNGDSPLGVFLGATAGFAVGATAGYMIANNNGYDKKTTTLTGAIIGGVLGGVAGNYGGAIFNNDNNVLKCFNFQKKWIDDPSFFQRIGYYFQRSEIGTEKTIMFRFKAEYIRKIKPDKLKIVINKGLINIPVLPVRPIFQDIPDKDPVDEEKGDGKKKEEEKPGGGGGPPKEKEVIKRTFRSAAPTQDPWITLSKEQVDMMNQIIKLAKEAGKTKVILLYRSTSSEAFFQLSKNYRRDANMYETFDPKTGLRIEDIGGHKGKTDQRKMILDQQFGTNGWNNLMEQRVKMLDYMKNKGMKPTVEFKASSNFNGYDVEIQ